MKNFEIYIVPPAFRLTGKCDVRRMERTEKFSSKDEYNEMKRNMTHKYLL